jgi:hypothetical protein
MGRRTGIRITAKDTRELQRLIREVPARLDAAGRKAATEMVSEMKLSMLDSPPDTSKSYGKGHHPSFPDNPPRPDMSSLINSIRWEDAGKHMWHHMDGVAHGLFMETGTESVQARPWVAPVYEDWRNNKFLPFLKRELQLE